MIAMHPLIRTLLVAAACAAAPWACRAADGVITISGKVVSETCTINGGGAGSSFAVTLPNVSTASLATPGATAGRTQFSIALANCAGFTSGSVFPYFEPGPTINATGRLANGGTAGNLDVELLNASFGVMNLSQGSGSQNATPVAVAGNAAVLTYYAQYRATGLVTAGTVTTTVNYTIVYP
jgi:major type 1 subunit fimbrin (pilin)